jgi:uncharacterized membrane protein
MSEPTEGPRRYPDHVDQAVRSISALHSDHRGRASRWQRLANFMSGMITRPAFLVILLIAIVAWIGGNVGEVEFGKSAVDLPAFPWLQGAVGLFSLFVVMLVLVAQRHEDEINARREILTLEIAMMSERKIAKVIELLEELRRDSPHVADRLDLQANEMAQPVDSSSVIAAAADAQR